MAAPWVRSPGPTYVRVEVLSRSWLRSAVPIFLENPVPFLMSRGQVA